VLVVDGGSRDDTVARARAFSARVITNPWPGYRAQKQFALDQARADTALVVERYRARWAASLAELRLDLEGVRTERRQLGEERALYTVTAPVTGTAEQVSSISPGSFVQAGEALAVISPASGLVAEVYVSPRDVGLIRVGGPVRMLIDAFNYNDWGFVTGRVLEVSGDFVQVGGQAAIAGHLRIGEGARIGAQAGVMSDVPSGAALVGSPAQPRQEFFRQVATLKRMARQPG
jgi:acetyltransferase-like isoleucine patch superfamily enzyme